MLHTSRSKVARLVTATLGLTLLVSSCGRSSEERQTASSEPTTRAKTVEDALPRVKAMVDAAAAVLAAGFHVEPDPGFEPTGCEDSAGNDDGTITASYNLKFALPEGTDIATLFEKARTYWRQHGYQVSTVDLAIGDPAIDASWHDYNLSLHVVKKTNMAYLGGDTPCLAEAKK